MTRRCLGVQAALWLLAAGCGGTEEIVPVPPLPLDAGLVGDASPRPLVVVGDRSSDRLEFFSMAPGLQRVAALSLDDNPGWIDEPFDLARAPDGKSLYVVLGHGVAWATGKLVKIRIADGARLGEVALGEEPSMVALSADGRRAYVTLFRNLAHPQGPWSDPGALVVVDTEAMRVQGQVEVCAAALGVVLDEPARRAWVACAGATDVALVDVSVDTAPRLERTVPLSDGSGGKGAQPAYLTLTASHVHVAAQGTGDLWILDRASGVLAKRISFGADAFPQRLVWHEPSGYVLVALDGRQQIAVIDDAALLEVGRIPLPGVHPQGLALSGPRTLLVTDEGDLKSPGRLVEVDLCPLVSAGCDYAVLGSAPTAVFPQAVLVLP